MGSPQEAALGEKPLLSLPNLRPPGPESWVSRGQRKPLPTTAVTAAGERTVVFVSRGRTHVPGPVSALSEHNHVRPGDNWG